LCSSFYRGDDDEKEYLVKWKELSYDECYWEFESDISAFQPEIERFNKIQSRRRRPASNKLKNTSHDVESQKKSKEFHQYEQSPEFLSGGMLSSSCFPIINISYFSAYISCLINHYILFYINSEFWWVLN